MLLELPTTCEAKRLKRAELVGTATAREANQHDHNNSPARKAQQLHGCEYRQRAKTKKG